MSDAKRTGSRDISELKQRLGLKKGGAASQTGATPRVNGGTGGVVPPPGLNLPPPPGVTPAAPPQPVIPNAADDPFGAMNAMAAVGTVHRAPEIVVVNDGQPVHQVGGSSKLLAIVAIIVGVLGIVIGMAFGRISRGASDFNDGVNSASTILEANKALKSTLNDIQTKIFEKIQPTTASNPQAKPKAHPNIIPDKDLDKKLSQISAKLEIKAAQFALVRNITNESDAAGEVLEFYAGLTELRAMIDLHVRASTSEDQAYKAAQAAADKANVKPDENASLAGQLRYAVVISGPTEKDKSAPFGAKLVELGPPYCSGKLATGGKCGEGESPSAYGYRSDIGTNNWTPGEPAEPADKVSVDKILPFVPSTTLDMVVRGKEPSAAENAYALRVQAIVDKTDDLLKKANKLEPGLQKAASAGTKFTFFM